MDDTTIFNIRVVLSVRLVRAFKAVLLEDSLNFKTDKIAIFYYFNDCMEVNVEQKTI